MQCVKNETPETVASHKERRKDYKLEMERCIIELRKELELVILEKYG
jgi:hypothetical protein